MEFFIVAGVVVFFTLLVEHKIIPLVKEKIKEWRNQ